MLPAVFDRYRSQLDAELKSALAACETPMYVMLRYHLGWVDEQGNALPASAGKALRPTLCLLACEATAGAYHHALPAAATLELIHNFSLIHDDVQDDDHERRHRPTVWAIWGKPQAINAGTAMRVLASLTALRLEDRGVRLPTLLRALRLLDESSLRLIEGQFLDISFEARLDVSVADYLDMIKLKTASLIACSLELGALLGTSDERAVQALRACGRWLGLAFQIRDDVLGIWGDPEKTGKPVGSDIRCRKKSLPVVYALEKTEGGARAELHRIYQQETIGDDDLEIVLGLLEAIGAPGWAQGVAEEYGARAMAEAASLKLSAWASQSLNEMISFLVWREF
jgi:geranylgeranyl diphosphate synthase type I